MLDESILSTAYGTNPNAFFLLEAVRKEGYPTELEVRYANPAAAALDAAVRARLPVLLFGRLGQAWLRELYGPEGQPESRTVYIEEDGADYRLDCFPWAERGFFGCMVQETASAGVQPDEPARRLYEQDPMTGVLNFDGFKRAAVRLMNRAPERKYAVWYCDIKRFKYINDVFGYEAGDRLLCHWAEVIRNDLKEGEACGRISGDRMTILTWYDAPEELEQRFRHRAGAVRDFLNLPGQRFEIEIKSGVYCLKPGEAERLDINQMLDWANVAQRSIKDQSGSCMAFFTDDLWRKQLRELEISQHVHAGLEAGEFSLRFQPQYDYLDDRLCGAEALVRWNHPTLGPLSPVEFIPVLERDGQITELDRFVWEEACRCMKRWREQRPDRGNISLSVNVSRADIRSAGLCESLCGLVKRYGLSPEMLRLEITESAYMEEPDQIVAVAGRLRELGFTVEMDDFGSGYSSLNMLKDVPVDILKLDMRFLSRSGIAFRSGNILSSVIRMAHWMELPVIAEGVETGQQADYLKSLGCYMMQGYYFARPLPENEFLTLVDTLPGEEPRRSYQSIGLSNMAEFLDNGQESSFLFTRCIGGGAVLEYDGWNMEALMLNDAFYEVIGMGHEVFDHYRTHMLDVIDPEDRPEMRRVLDQAVSAGSALGEMRLQREAEGAERWIQVRYRCLSSNAQRHILFVQVEDVTVQHQTKAELETVTTELRSYLDLMPGGVLRYSADGEGRLDYVSRGLAELLGCAPEALLDQGRGKFLDLVCPEDRPKVGLAGGGHCEYRVMQADGTLRWVYQVQRQVTDSHGNNWIYAVVTDIDDQKRSESSRQFEVYGKAMADVFDEVSDLDYESDTAVLMHTRYRCETVGKRFCGAAEVLERCTAKWGLEGSERERYLAFLRPEHVAELYRSGRADSIELCDSAGRWYRSVMLPLSEGRALFCTVDVTAWKRAEQLSLEAARSEGVKDLLTWLPVGAAVFETSGDKPRLRYLSQAGQRILQVDQQQAEALMDAPESAVYLPSPEEWARFLDGGEPYERLLKIPVGGGERYIELVTSLRRGQSGSIVGYTAFWDMTGKIEAEYTQRWKESLYRILSKLPRLVAFDYDPKEDRMTKCISLSENRGVEQITNHYLQQLDQAVHLPPEGIEALRGAFRTALAAPAEGTVDYQADYFGQGLRWSRAHYLSLADESGTIYRIVGRVDDVEEESVRERNLREMVQRDSMTGLLNHDASQAQISAAIREHGGGTLILVDIDDFKRVNDHLGHLYGDTFLQQTAAAIRAMFRKEDVVGRFGGDEFIVFMPGAHNEQLAAHMAGDVVRAVEGISVPELGTVRCSVGVAVAEHADTSPTVLFQRADLALYEAKRGGKGRYAVFRDEEKAERPGRMPETGGRTAVPEMILNTYPRMLAGDVFGILYHSGAAEAGLQAALAYVGRWMKVSRCYIFENQPDGRACCCTFRWCAEGAEPVPGAPWRLELDGGLDIYGGFDRNGLSCCTDVSALPAWKRALLEPQRTSAFLHWAFRWNGVFRGFVGFDLCGGACTWQEEQVSGLLRSAEVISVFLRTLREPPARKDAPENGADET